MKYCIITLLFVLIKSNIWDNMFSEMSAKTPIVLSSSLNFQFPFDYNEIQFTGQFDYNHELHIVNLYIKKKIIFFQADLFQIEADLKTEIITILQALQPCSRYKLDLLEQIQSGQDLQSLVKKPFSKVFLLNVLFQYQRTENDLRVYHFQPNILTGQQLEIEEDFTVMVDANGEVQQIHDKDNKKIPFSLTSKVKEKTNCQAQVETVQSKQIEQMVRKYIEGQIQV